MFIKASHKYESNNYLLQEFKLLDKVKGIIRSFPTKKMKKNFISKSNGELEGCIIWTNDGIYELKLKVFIFTLFY